MIVRCTIDDFQDIYDIINDGAAAYKGVIPADTFHEPYMDAEELRKQIIEGVEFWGYLNADQLAGVMGIQFKGDVSLIRHAYVRTAKRGRGIGGRLLRHLQALSNTPILIGTWKDAHWAIGFYEKHDFRLLMQEQKELLLKKYWNIPQRQAELSVVLASPDWHDGLP
jgi:GNAT superfamily N-acetyltransferase